MDGNEKVPAARSTGQIDRTTVFQAATFLDNRDLDRDRDRDRDRKSAMLIGGLLNSPRQADAARSLLSMSCGHPAAPMLALNIQSPADAHLRRHHRSSA